MGVFTAFFFHFFKFYVDGYFAYMYAVYRMHAMPTETEVGIRSSRFRWLRAPCGCWQMSHLCSPLHVIFFQKFI